MVVVVLITVLAVELAIAVSNTAAAKQRNCFDAKTLITLTDGTTKHIAKIEVGDILENGDKVTAFFKLATNSSPPLH